MFLQKEEGLIQGQLNHSDSRQYINELRDQIAELKNEVRRTHQAAAFTGLCYMMNNAEILCHMQLLRLK